MSLSIPTENLSAYSASLSDKLNGIIAELRRLFLVENMIDTLKVGMALPPNCLVAYNLGLVLGPLQLRCRQIAALN